MRQKKKDVIGYQGSGRNL